MRRIPAGIMKLGGELILIDDAGRPVGVSPGHEDVAAIASVTATPPVRTSVSRSRRSQDGRQRRGKGRSLTAMSAARQAAISASTGTR